MQIIISDLEWNFNQFHLLTCFELYHAAIFFRTHKGIWGEASDSPASRERSAA